MDKFLIDCSQVLWKTPLDPPKKLSVNPEVITTIITTVITINNDQDRVGINSFSLLDKVEIYKKRTIMPPRKMRIRAFNIHKDVSRCNTTPNNKDDPTKFKHKTSGWEIKTLTSKSKKKIEIITPRV